MKKKAHSNNRQYQTSRKIRAAERPQLRTRRQLYSVNDEEKAIIDEKAMSVGLKTAEYVRLAALGCRISVPNFRKKQFITELTRQGNNLNQTSKALNELIKGLHWFQEQIPKIIRIMQETGSPEQGQRTLNVLHKFIASLNATNNTAKDAINKNLELLNEILEID